MWRGIVARLEGIAGGLAGRAGLRPGAEIPGQRDRAKVPEYRHGAERLGLRAGVEDASKER